MTDHDRDELEAEAFAESSNEAEDLIRLGDLTQPIPPSQLTETEGFDSRLSSIVEAIAGARPAETVIGICSLCACEAVALVAGYRVCRFHRDHASAQTCGDCARREAFYAAKPPVTEQLSHPTAPNVPASALPDVPSTLSQIVKDFDIDLKPADVNATQEDLDSEYREVFDGTEFQCKDLEPEALQVIRHRNLRMIRRAKIMNQKLRILEEGKLQLIPESRKRAIREKDTEFYATRGKVPSSEKVKGEKRASSSTGMSAAEKQIKQFVKLNMPDEAIIATLKAVGSSIPENVSEVIARYRR